MQAQLQAAATARRGRVRTNAGSSTSALTGRVFDETGERLTPTHTKTRSGTRLRYYVSHRLIQPGEVADRSGWRLPGPQLEAAVAEAVSARLEDPTMAAMLMAEPTADSIETTALRLACRTAEARENLGPTHILALVERVDLAPGQMAIRLGANALATLLECGTDALGPAALTFAMPFRTRKRGVETRLMLGAGCAARPIDRTLLANIARGEMWFRRVKAGDTYAAIARAEGVSKDRVTKLIPFAFLSPRLVARVVAGTQPAGLSTEYLIRHDIPADWQEQEQRFAALA